MTWNNLIPKSYLLVHFQVLSGCHLSIFLPASKINWTNILNGLLSAHHAHTAHLHPSTLSTCLFLYFHVSGVSGGSEVNALVSFTLSTWESSYTISPSPSNILPDWNHKPGVDQREVKFWGGQLPPLFALGLAYMKSVKFSWLWWRFGEATRGIM